MKSMQLSLNHEGAEEILGGMETSMCSYLALIAVAWLSCVNGFAYELTFPVEAGETECFYQPIITPGLVIDVDYQVIEGAGMDITFTLVDPKQKLLKIDTQKEAGSHQLRFDEAGDYQFCFSNKFSRMTSKLVFFEVYSDHADPSFHGAQEAEKSADAEAAGVLIGATVDQAEVSLAAIKRNTEKCKSLQSLLVSHMIRDRNIVEASFTRVNLFSGGYLFVMVSVSLVQVLMIRNLFTTPAAHQIKMAT